MNIATKQKIFDKVSAHLLAQNSKSMNDGECAYRGEDGKKCAIGCLISDEMYEPEMEGEMVSGLVKGWGLRPFGMDPFDEYPPDVVSLLSGLQVVHDHCRVEDWPAILDFIRVREGLFRQVPK